MELEPNAAFSLHLDYQEIHFGLAKLLFMLNSYIT